MAAIFGAADKPAKGLAQAGADEAVVVDAAAARRLACCMEDGRPVS